MMFLTIGTMCTMAYAQRTETKTTVKYQDSQARMVETEAHAYVHPLTVELKVDTAQGRLEFTQPFSKEDAEVAFQGKVPNMRSFALFQFAKRYHADAIVAPTFAMENDENGDYVMRVYGYLGHFKHWKTATQKDYEWIFDQKRLTTADRDKFEAIVK